MSLNKDYQDFNQIYACAPLEITPTNAFNRLQLVAQELVEALDECCEDYTITLTKGSIAISKVTLKDSMDIPAFIKESLDIGYINYQGLAQMQVDLDRGQAALQTSNLSKGFALNQMDLAFAECNKLLERYPNACVVQTNKGYCIKDLVLDKVCKPSTYTPTDMGKLVCIKK